MNSIKLRVHKSAVINKNLTGTIKITPEAEIVIRQLALETGLSARSIISQIVVQAADIIEIEEVDICLNKK